ncbi:MAG: CRISPR-associated RAMP protein Csx7 [Myxococcota bacterium]|nr:CRISPR-associated RAMP protein Csx7 [Myxococcota bacterium]MDW8362892.1 CRISPR-associated RAMP protein Csx7 [Myxococcales bacterium]
MTGVAVVDSPFFDRLVRRTRLDAEMVCVTPLRIGRGKRFDAVESDLPVLRDAQGRVVVPGASIKGVLRSHLEALMRSMGLSVCDPLAAPCIDGSKVPRRGGAAERARAWRQYVGEHACHACRMFGSLGLASHVVLTDALPLGEVHTEIRDGVAIDRDLGRVSGARKYDFEVVAAGSRFAFSLELHDLSDAQEGAVALALDSLHEGFARIGGAKSRGFGVVRLENGRVHVRTATDAQAMDWETWRRERSEAYAAWLRNEVNRCTA